MKPVAYKAKGYYKPVQNGLAVRPSEVAELTARGIAVTSQNVNKDDPGFHEKSLDVTAKRGFDLNTAWEMSKVSRSKIINAHKLDSKLYGTT